jgi:hypothetical protein
MPGIQTVATHFSVQMNVTKTWLVKVVKKTFGLFVYVELGAVLAYKLFRIFPQVSFGKRSKLACFPHIPGLSVMRIRMKAMYR